MCEREWDRLPGLMNDAAFLASTWLPSAGHRRLYPMLRSICCCPRIVFCLVPTPIMQIWKKVIYSSSPVLKSIAKATEEILGFM